MQTHTAPVDILIVAVPETAGSALYGMVDVLKAAGSIWETLTREGEGQPLFDVRIISIKDRPFRCGNGIPVQPDCAIGNTPGTRVIILPELWLGPDEEIQGRYPALMAWLRDAYQQGSSLYSACSGAVMLAETGLLDGCEATSHWAYQELFNRRYPNVRFQPQPNLVVADRDGRIVTAGGTTSWHDLALHIIARYSNPAEALRIAKVYLLKWHDEGQLPYKPLLRSTPHADSKVRECQHLLKDYFREGNAIQRVIQQSAIPERTLKRRFKRATGLTFIEYVQNLRIEEAKHVPETTARSAEDISVEVGYEDHAFFRRLFRRLTGLRPSEYRRLFQPVIKSAGASDKRHPVRLEPAGE